MLSSPLESPEGSALLGLGLGQGLPWGRSPWAGSSIGGSPPARIGGAEHRGVDKGESGEGDAGVGALSGTDTGALATLTLPVLFGHLHVAVDMSSETDILLETSEEG